MKTDCGNVAVINNTNIALKKFYTIAHRLDTELISNLIIFILIQRKIL